MDTGGDKSPLMSLINNMQLTRETFMAMGEVIKNAEARILMTLNRIDPEHPAASQLNEALSPLLG